MCSSDLFWLLVCLRPVWFILIGPDSTPTGSERPDWFDLWFDLEALSPAGGIRRFYWFADGVGVIFPLIRPALGAVLRLRVRCQLPPIRCGPEEPQGIVSFSHFKRGGRGLNAVFQCRNLVL